MRHEVLLPIRAMRPIGIISGEQVLPHQRLHCQLSFDGYQAFGKMPDGFGLSAFGLPAVFISRHRKTIHREQFNMFLTVTHFSRLEDVSQNLRPSINEFGFLSNCKEL
jgi:hypothetical protein